MTRPARRPARTGLQVSVTDGRGGAVSAALAAGLRAWLPRAAPLRTRGDVSIALISDPAMRRLNRLHRGVDRATDVLSFPAEPAGRVGPAPVGPVAPVGPAPLGDIAIARGVASRQARAAGHSLRTELRILALHGLLHLLGYDHEGDHGQMARVEERLRRWAGLPAGLIARATRSDRPRH